MYKTLLDVLFLLSGTEKALWFFECLTVNHNRGQRSNQVETCFMCFNLSEHFVCVCLDVLFKGLKITISTPV